MGATSASRRDLLIVQVAQGPGQKLVVELDFNVVFGDRTARPILPGFVARVIRAAATGRDWQPRGKGPVYETGLRTLLPDQPPPPHRHGLLMDVIELKHPTHGELVFERAESLWQMITPKAGAVEPWAIWEAMEFLAAPHYERPPEERVRQLLASFEEAECIWVRARKTEHPAESRYTDTLAIGPSDGQQTVFRFQCWPERNYVAAGDWRSVFDRCADEWLA